MQHAAQALWSRVWVSEPPKRSLCTRGLADLCPLYPGCHQSWSSPGCFPIPQRLQPQAGVPWSIITAAAALGLKPPVHEYWLAPWLQP